MCLAALSGCLALVMNLLLNQFAMLDKVPWPSLNYAFPNQAGTLTIRSARTKPIVRLPRKTIFTETELDLWLFRQLKFGAG